MSTDAKISIKWPGSLSPTRFQNLTGSSEITSAHECSANLAKILIKLLIDCRNRPCTVESLLRGIRTIGATSGGLQVAMCRNCHIFYSWDNKCEIVWNGYYRWQRKCCFIVKNLPKFLRISIWPTVRYSLSGILFRGREFRETIHFGVIPGIFDSLGTSDVMLHYLRLSRWMTYRRSYMYTCVQTETKQFIAYTNKYNWVNTHSCVVNAHVQLLHYTSILYFV